MGCWSGGVVECCPGGRLLTRAALLREVAGQKLEVAAVMPGLAGSALQQERVAMVRLPMLDALSRQVSLIWSRKMAEVRPAIALHAKLLTSLFRNDFKQRDGSTKA